MKRRDGRSGLSTPLDWLDHAVSDLRLARLARRHKGIRPELVGFHAQQASEKALKAVLLARGGDFPFVHDLERLIDVAAKAGLSIPARVAAAGALTPYAVQLRYPGTGEEIGGDEMKEAIELASRVLKWARSQVPAGAGKPIRRLGSTARRSRRPRTR